MSSKNPVHNLARLKKLVNGDDAGRVALKVVDDDIEVMRPKKRADCLPGGINEARPCPWYGCRYHLGLEIKETGALSTRDIDDMAHTCVLDVSEIGSPPGTGHGTAITLEEVGEILDVTRERARQIEVSALFHIMPGAQEAGLDPNAPADEQISSLNGHDAKGLGKINGHRLAVREDED